MLTVFKYPVPPGDNFTLALPEGARLLTVAPQSGEPQLWALVNTDNPPEDRQFRLAGTGHPIDEAEDTLHYVGTFHMMRGALVFHLFEVIVQVGGAQ